MWKIKPIALLDGAVPDGPVLPREVLADHRAAQQILAAAHEQAAAILEAAREQAEHELATQRLSYEAQFWQQADEVLTGWQAQRQQEEAQLVTLADRLLNDALHQLLLTRQRDAGQRGFGLRLAALGAQLHQRGFHLFDLVFGLLRVNHPQQLILLHAVADVYRQGFQLAADLGADVHFAERVELTGGQHALLEIVLARDERLVLRRRGVQRPPDPDGCQQYDHQQQQIALFKFSLEYHVIPASFGNKFG